METYLVSKAIKEPVTDGKIPLPPEVCCSQQVKSKFAKKYFSTYPHMCKIGQKYYQIYVTILHPASLRKY
jgi:hypothetical protein